MQLDSWIWSPCMLSESSSLSRGKTSTKVGREKLPDVSALVASNVEGSRIFHPQLLCPHETRNSAQESTFGQTFEGLPLAIK